MGRRIVVLAVLVCLACGCAIAPASRNSSSEALPKNPCFDPVFVALLEKPVEEMTEREYQLYAEKERACAAYRQADLQTKPKRDLNTILGFFVGGTLAIAALTLIIANGE